MTEFLHNLTFQALRNGNDKVHLNFDNIGILVYDILECLARKDQQSINVAKILNEYIKQELDKRQFELELRAGLQIQEDLEMYLKKDKKPPNPPPRYPSTLLLNEKEINKIYNDTKEDYLKTAITIN